MKVALVFSGLPRGNYIQNIEDHRSVFGGPDVYLNSWAGTLCEAPYRCNYWPEPESDHLLLSVSDLENPYKRTILARGYKQIMAHTYAMVQLPDEYDVIVRCRYDVIVNPEIDWTAVVEECYKNKTVIGIRNFIEDEWSYLKHVRPKGLVLDQLIVHTPEQYDCSRVINLYTNKELDACEMGWYQVFQSQPIKNYIGGCKIDR